MSGSDMKQFIIYLCIALSLFIYVSCKAKKSLDYEINELKNIIDVKKSELKRYKLISEKAEHEKIQLENKSIQTIEKLKNALKNNKCSNERVSAYIADKLYTRAHKIRQSASHSS